MARLATEADLEFFMDKRKRWRWRLVGANGRVIAHSAEGDGFTSLSKAKRNLQTTMTRIEKAVVRTSRSAKPRSQSKTGRRASSLYRKAQSGFAGLLNLYSKER